MISSIWTYLAGFWKANAGIVTAAADRAPLDHHEQRDPVIDAACEVFAGSATIVPAPAVPTARSAAQRRPCRADGLSEGRVLQLLVEKGEELGSPLAAAQYLFHPREDQHAVEAAKAAVRGGQRV
ncbi:hypothetical protein ACFYOK_37460 [Microbispora bryophytorum]|uniref:hypothetical protein n=1 Tax=Microbispora bryophytorum TaxID=1460882 RepID=UPI0033FBCDFA